MLRHKVNRLWQSGQYEQEDKQEYGRENDGPRSPVYRSRFFHVECRDLTRIRSATAGEGERKSQGRGIHY